MLIKHELRVFQNGLKNDSSYKLSGEESLEIVEAFNKKKILKLFFQMFLRLKYCQHFAFNVTTKQM